VSEFLKDLIRLLKIAFTFGFIFGVIYLILSGIIYECKCYIREKEARIENIKALTDFYKNNHNLKIAKKV